jgi:hypothetical protein
MPERQWQHAHQRAISVFPFISRATALRWRTRAQRVQCARSLETDIKHDSVDRAVTTVGPIEQASGKIVQIEPLASEQRCQQTKCLRAIV